MRGKVKTFNSRKGYGFIVTDNKDEFFVHYSQIQADGYRKLFPGQQVEFELCDGPKGVQASCVKVV